MTDDLKAELQTLRHRVDRIYHWAWAAGVAAAILGTFGIKLNLDLAEIAARTQKAYDTASSAHQIASEAKTRLDVQLKSALDSMATRAEELTERLEADATRHVADAWGEISADLKLIKHGDSIRLVRSDLLLTIDNLDQGPLIRTGWRKEPDPDDRTDFTIHHK